MPAAGSVVVLQFIPQLDKQATRHAFEAPDFVLAQFFAPGTDAPDARSFHGSALLAQALRVARDDGAIQRETRPVFFQPSWGALLVVQQLVRPVQIQEIAEVPQHGLRPRHQVFVEDLDVVGAAQARARTSGSWPGENHCWRQDAATSRPSRMRWTNRASGNSAAIASM